MDPNILLAKGEGKANSLIFIAKWSTEPKISVSETDQISR
jgi:hypothetical protein